MQGQRRATGNLMGVAEIAALAGVGRQAVHNWRRRHPDFPKPVAELQSGLIFRRKDAERWLRAHGKIK